MRKDKVIKIQYASKYARVANYWKKWIGEKQGLEKSNAVQIKRDFEKKFNQKVKEANKTAEYGSIIKDFKEVYEEITEYSLARDYFNEVVLRNTELLSIGYKLYQLENAFNAKGEQAFNDRKSNLLKELEESYKNFNPIVDERVFEQLLSLYISKSPYSPPSLLKENLEKLTSDVYKKSKLTSYEGVKELLKGDAKSIIKDLNKDNGYELVKLLTDHYNDKVIPIYTQLTTKTNSLQRQYMKAQLELFPDARYFPDANSTLRVTYGKVQGYHPKDAIFYEPVTHLDGIIEKYIPGDYEFDVPTKLIQLYKNKDYGIYGEDGKMPVCFLGTNHTTGGNSGSPAIDAEGNLIGLNFDRVWEGTMSDIHYDPEICRNIMVDIRYVLFIIDKYANADNLIEEMKLVHPKKSGKKGKRRR